MRKSIYQPLGKAGEYSEWACNLYNGCPHDCSYCYNNHSITAGTLGGTTVRLKKVLVDEPTAFSIFAKELNKYRAQIINKGSLHFNFVSDPCLPETIVLNWKCIDYAISQGVPCQILTKRADWLSHPSVQGALSHKNLIKIGFTLTGCDELEPGASTNQERIWSMANLHDRGIPTWASIEPIIDPMKSYDMVARTINVCDHYKIGILSGKKDYTPKNIRDFVKGVEALAPKSVYWKESLREFVQK